MLFKSWFFGLDGKTTWTILHYPAGKDQSNSFIRRYGSIAVEVSYKPNTQVVKISQIDLLENYASRY